MLLPWNPFARARAGHEVLPGVHLLGTRRVNFYAVEEGASITLIDCGFDGHMRYLRAWLERRSRRLSHIEAVLLTHGHADHFGFAGRLRRMGIPVYLHSADLPLATTPAGRRPPQRLLRSLWRPATMGVLLEATLDGVFTQPLVHEVRRLRDGDRIDAPGRPLVVAAPGHSPGSVAFHLLGQGALLSGDALMTRDPMRAGPDRAIVFADHTDRNRDAYDALDRLRPFGDCALLPAHGESWTGAGAVAHAIDQAVIA